MTTKFDNRELRRALGSFVTGVTVVTTIDELDRPRGLTVNSFASVSLDPPLISICIAEQAASFESFERESGFTVNILAENQRSVSDLFATKSPDKFAQVEWESGMTGAPRIKGSITVFDCQVHERIEAGDHLLIIGRIVNFETQPASPLVYAQGGYVPLSPRETAMEQPPGKPVVVSCIAEYSGQIALIWEDTEAGSFLVLPGTRPTVSSTGEIGPLRSAMEHFGLAIEITFLYSVFSAASPPTIHIVYRGFLHDVSARANSVELYSEDEIPWEDVNPAYRGMLRRFFRERLTHRFGIYMDGEDGGSVGRVEDEPESWDEYHLRFTSERRSNI